MKISRLAINDEGFIFDPETGNSYTVNETGLFILKRLKEGKTPEEIASELSENYDVATEEALRDVLDFLEKLKSFGLAG